MFSLGQTPRHPVTIHSWATNTVGGALEPGAPGAGMGAGDRGGGPGGLPRWVGRSIARRAALSAAMGSFAVALAFIATASALHPGGRVHPGLLVVGLLSVAVSASLAFTAASRNVAPLRRLTAEARQGDTSEALESLVVQGDDELADAVRALNELLARLRQAAAAQAEEAARGRREAEGRLGLVERALGQASEGLGVVTAAGEVVFANDAAARKVGRPRGAELAGCSLFEIDPTVTRETWDDLWTQLRAGRPVRHDHVSPGPHGVVMVERLAGLAVVDGREYAILTSRDVTEQRRAEAGQRLAAVGTLAAGVAHEVNNPLASVLANGHYALERLRTAPWAGGSVRLEARELDDLAAALEDSLRAGERVREVVAGLHLFATPAGQVRQPVDPRGEVEAALRLAENDLRHRARVVRRLGEVPPVEAGANQLAQVFLQLLLNAAEALRDGRPERNTLEVTTATGKGGWAVVEVRDDGPGIAAAALPHVFDPFFTTKAVGKGAGLGLSICHGVIRALGGEIQVESAPGRGATFRVLLPPSARPLREEAPTLTPAPMPAVPRRRVLVIDDDPVVLRALARALRQHEVTALGSAREALARFEAGERWDAVLCDLMMPELDGIELHAALHRTAPDQAARFVVVTGGAVTERARDFLARPEVRRLLKPLEPGALLAAVEAVATGEAPPQR